jgi:hypothetical protein
MLKHLSDGLDAFQRHLGLTADLQDDAGALTAAEGNQHAGAKQFAGRMRETIVEQGRQWYVERDPDQLHQRLG